MQRTRQMDRVGVGEEQPLAPRFSGSGNYGVVLARPTLGQRFGRNDSDTEQTLSNLSRAIGRVVVNNDDFELQALLPHQRSKAVSQGDLFVARGHDDAYFHPWVGRRAGGINIHREFRYYSYVARTLTVIGLLLALTGCYSSAHPARIGS